MAENEKLSQSNGTEASPKTPAKKKVGKGGAAKEAKAAPVYGSVEHQVLELESAQKQQGEQMVAISQTVEVSMNLLKDVAEKVQLLSDKVTAQPQRAARPTTDLRKTVAGEVKAHGEQASRKRNIDFKNPDAELTGFQPDEYVEIVEDSPLYAAYLCHPDTGEPLTEQDKKEGIVGEPAIGVILNYMYTKKKTRMRKYLVQFPKFGRDGLLENELRYVSV